MNVVSGIAFEVEGFDSPDLLPIEHQVGAALKIVNLKITICND
jgi:hypothetical protein